MALDAIDLGIVLGDRTIEIEAQDLARIGVVILAVDLVLGGKGLGQVGPAEIAAEIGALFTDGIIDLFVGTEHHTTGVVVVPGRQSLDQDHRIDQLLEVFVIGIAHDLGRGIGLFGSAVVDRIADIDVVVACAFEQFGMQRHAEQTLMLGAGIDVLESEEHLFGARNRVDTRDFTAGALRHPDHVVGAPAQCPWIVQTGGQHTRGKQRIVAAFDLDRRHLGSNHARGKHKGCGDRASH